MATEEDLVNAAVAAIAADPNIDAGAKAVMGSLMGDPWYDAGPGSFHSLRALARGWAPFFTGGGTPPTPDHLQSQLTTPFNFAAGDTIFKDVSWDVDHEAQGLSSAGAAVAITVANLYEVKYEFDLGVPSATGVTVEGQVLLNGSPIAQSTSHEGSHTVTGQDQLVHPGFLVSLSASDILKVQLRCTTAIASWNVINGHLQVRKV